MRDKGSPCLSQLLLFSELGKPCSQFVAFQFLESRAPGDHNSNKYVSICFLTREDLRLLQGFVHITQNSVSWKFLILTAHTTFLD